MTAPTIAPSVRGVRASASRGRHLASAGRRRRSRARRTDVGEDRELDELALVHQLARARQQLHVREVGDHREPGEEPCDAVLRVRRADEREARAGRGRLRRVGRWSRAVGAAASRGSSARRPPAGRARPGRSTRSQATRPPSAAESAAMRGVLLGRERGVRSDVSITGTGGSAAICAFGVRRALPACCWIAPPALIIMRRRARRSTSATPPTAPKTTPRFAAKLRWAARRAGEG